MKSDSFYKFFAELFVSEEKIKTNFRKHIIFLFRQKKKKVGGFVNQNIQNKSRKI